MASLLKNVRRTPRHRLWQKSVFAVRIWPVLQVGVMLMVIGLAPFSVGALGRFLSRNPMAGTVEAVVEWSVFN